LKPRIAVELTGAVGLGLMLMLYLIYPETEAYFLYLLFGAAIATGAFNYILPVDAPPELEPTTAFAPGPAINEEHDFPQTEFDKAKAQDAVELVTNLHNAIKPGDSDFSETTYSYPGLKGRIVKGKKPEQPIAQAPQEPSSDLGEIAQLPPAEE
jgi:hypothetical protein